MSATTGPTPTPDREFVLRRMIHAPREKTFKAWIHPELLKKWFAPLPYTPSVAQQDARPDGENRAVIRDSQDKKTLMRGVHLEVVENERFVFADANTRGWEPATKPFLTVTLTLNDENGRTRYTAHVRHWTVAGREPRETREFHHGWGQSGDQPAALATRP